MPWFAIGIVISKRIYIGQTKVLDKNSEYTDFFFYYLKKPFFERQTQIFLYRNSHASTFYILAKDFGLSEPTKCN